MKDSIANKLEQLVGRHEEIGNLLDPGATKDSPHYPFIEALEARGTMELGGAYDEILKQDGPSWAALLDPDYPLAVAKSEDDPTGWGASRGSQQPPENVEHTYAVYGKNPSAKQQSAREGHVKSGKKLPMANRRMVGLLKMIRNVAFAHRSQNVQVCGSRPPVPKSLGHIFGGQFGEVGRRRRRDRK